MCSLSVLSGRYLFEVRVLCLLPGTPCNKALPGEGLVKKERLEMERQEVVDQTAFTLENDMCRLRILTYGATLQEFSIQDEGWKNLILSYDTVEEYKTDTYYLGATVGRVAGRIEDGTFDMDGATYHLPQNEGKHHLHGGDGLHCQFWKMEDVSNTHLVLRYVSPDGENGYKGTLDVRASFELLADGVKITYEAISDTDTVCDMTNHTYFNLSGGSRDILGHELTLPANQFAELRDDLIPTGRLLDVDQTPFDFRSGRMLGDGPASSHPQNQLVNGYDHPFLFDDQRKATLYDPESKRSLMLSTTAPALVLYSGNQMNEETILREGSSRKYYGVCLEPQHLPDAVHHSNFSSIRLLAGETYHWETEYRVGKGVSR